MAQNEYCNLIDTICLEVIPGYEVKNKFTLTGKYAPARTTPTPMPSLELKLNFTIRRTPNADG